jgi:CheY-like chemotaxis protein
MGGHEVTEADDGVQGIRVAEAHWPNVALVDVGLPGIDGYAVARALCELRRLNGLPLRLIAMTGYGQAEDKRRALEAGFDAHATKPVLPEQLELLIEATGRSAEDKVA